MKKTEGIWHPFIKGHYQYAWHQKYLIGIIEELFYDIKRAHQRIWKGYCGLDLCSIDWWFLKIMPAMLTEFKDVISSYPIIEEYGEVSAISADEEDAEGMAQWKEILDKMIFLLKEADEENCSKKNPYEEQVRIIWDEFREKYGSFGEKLLTEEEKADKTGTRMYMPSDVEEYKPIMKAYMEEEMRLGEYRTECKDQALVLFSK